MTISFAAWNNAAAIEYCVPIPKPNAMKPSSPTARNAIILLKSTSIADIAMLKAIARIANTIIAVLK